MALPWIEVIRKRAEIENIDIRICANNLAQELTQYGALQKQIERVSQELELINMSGMKKQEPLTLLTDLSNRGVSESQILSLIKFAAEWEATPGNNKWPRR